MGTWTSYPHSRGSIHITSSSPLSAPLFKPNFLSDTNDIDLKMLVWGYKKAREIIRRTTFYRGEISVIILPFLRAQQLLVLIFLLMTSTITQGSRTLRIVKKMMRRLKSSLEIKLKRHGMVWGLARWHRGTQAVLLTKN